MSENSRISPTAHYTGYIWYRHGLSHRALMTRQGQLLFAGVEPSAATYRFLGGPTMEMVLMQRHLIIDHLLSEGIASGRIGQVIEIAAGLSPRGYRFTQEHGSDLCYVEADLPDMAAHKKRLLEGANLLGPKHHVVPIDAFLDAGEGSLDHIGQTWLDPTVGTAIITEGLLNYFPVDAVEGLWARIARLLDQYPEGTYLSEMHLQCEANTRLAARLFRRMLSIFARGNVHIHYEAEDDARAALETAGFPNATLHRPASFTHELDVPRTPETLVRVIETRQSNSTRTTTRSGASSGNSTSQ